MRETFSHLGYKLITYVISVSLLFHVSNRMGVDDLITKRTTG